MGNEEESTRFFDEQKRYVTENQDAIRNQYGTDYIAVKDRKVIDHDKNEIALALRVEQQFRHELVLVSSLEDILHPHIDHLESPEEGS